jgi:phytoene dehydrogenase-like protein/NAD-dependent dihydropyrimidine dehydrogenase PreA subunit
MGIRVDENKCVGCSYCEICCPYDAIDVRVKARVDNDKCTDCGVCPDYCPTDAITMENPVPVQVGPTRDASFDVVVIGAGVGGLSAASLLAHRGYRTLLVERAPTVGGQLSSLKHNGIVFPTGGAVTVLGSPLDELFQELGPPTGLVPCEAADQAKTWQWLPGRGWIDPGPGPGQYRRILGKIAGNQEVGDQVVGSMREIRRTKQYPDGSALEWVSSLTDNEGIREYFRAFIGGLLGVEDLPARDFFSFENALTHNPHAVPERGGLPMLQQLTKLITQKGGEVWTKSRAKEIIVEDGSAAGVLVERRGQPWRVKATAVIGAIGPRPTLQLISPENLDPQYVSYLDQNSGAPQLIMMVHVITDRPLVGDFRGFMYPTGGRRLCVLWDVTNSCPEWCPPGQHIIEGYSYIWPYLDASPQDWQRWADETEQELDAIYPGWRQHGYVKMGFIPSGAFSGYGILPGSKWVGVPIETPIPNLFLAGDACGINYRGGGNGASESGQRAADLVSGRFARR